MKSNMDQLAASYSPSRLLRNGSFKFSQKSQGVGFFPEPDRAPAFELNEDALPSDLARARRHLSRAAILLATHASWIGPKLLTSKADLSRVGLYLALENGPVGMSPNVPVYGMDNFAQEFRSNFPPKQYLRHIVSISAVPLAQALGTVGPLTIFNHFQLGVIQAAAQACFDLQYGVVDQAILASVFTREDALTNARCDSFVSPERATEFSGAILIDKTQSIEIKRSEKCYAYGIASPLANFFLQEGNDA
jgi:hypothetical protein